MWGAGGPTTRPTHGRQCRDTPPNRDTPCSASSQIKRDTDSTAQVCVCVCCVLRFLLYAAFYTIYLDTHTPVSTPRASLTGRGLYRLRVRPGVLSTTPLFYSQKLAPYNLWSLVLWLYTLNTDTPCERKDLDNEHARDTRGPVERCARSELRGDPLFLLHVRSSVIAHTPHRSFPETDHGLGAEVPPLTERGV